MGLDSIPKSLGTVFSNIRYTALAGALAVLFYLLYIAVPVFGIPGNDFGFFLSSTPANYLLMTAILSIAVSIVFTMQIYAWKNNMHRITHSGAGIAGFVSGSVSVLFAGATCASCMSAVFSFLGFAGVVFLIEHRIEVTVLTYIILAGAFYLTSQRISDKCGSCSILEPDNPIKGGKNKKSGK